MNDKRLLMKLITKYLYFLLLIFIIIEGKSQAPQIDSLFIIYSNQAKISFDTLYGLAQSIQNDTVFIIFNENTSFSTKNEKLYINLKNENDISNAKPNSIIQYNYSFPKLKMSFENAILKTKNIDNELDSFQLGVKQLFCISKYLYSKMDFECNKTHFQFFHTNMAPEYTYDFLNFLTKKDSIYNELFMNSSYNSKSFNTKNSFGMLLINANEIFKLPNLIFGEKLVSESRLINNKKEEYLDISKLINEIKKYNHVFVAFQSDNQGNYLFLEMGYTYRQIDL